MDWKKESTMFDQTADYYDKYRPSYPQKVMDSLVSAANITDKSAILEIGSGSGKATELLVPYRCHILCVEPGSNLVREGRRKFAKYPFVRFEESRYEEYAAKGTSYDVIFSAQAFHWIPQPIGFEKCAAALMEGGYLALIWNMYLTYDNELDHELVALSNKYGGFADFLSEDGCEKRISSVASQIEHSGLFTKPQIDRHLWSQAYTADEYFGFMLTGNFFVQKSEEEKEEAYQDILALAGKHNGVIERPYLSVLYLSQKKARK
ncbi:class I SAM-dependent methyltransferase [Paenibacillus spongiae]|uniref:Class I SAM-dependent methyltransferase n=1 Tax=Paenibacillus spongiae TaxID=2909671 RepID=A0ABY5S938_9BACL|nr:class I SAM-dependent methyltransferase [Paenibacillus spongiae]UVI30426.1 class I SAM-dependent methyltransferase [Paenibacillus spongiae]